MLSSESKTQNTFSNATSDTKYYFKFRNFEFDQLENQEFKGLGYPGASQDDTIDSKKLNTTSFDKSEEKLLPPLNCEKFKNELSI
ncbi:3883_t:CDS:2 [Dentiscutata erythropus]|uniref:3880_t:CDS:1 n=1 Tax=Dentiscutata erythropus TaxID=1348616 RepID=A0A9N9GGR9_9GLOM|nr:3880_t:CDS:2 [Dentiscutata erythropus]CAG8601265.1 3883_t:CDS:2 [Dentiscutata erythropus]